MRRRAAEIAAREAALRQWRLQEQRRLAAERRDPANGSARITVNRSRPSPSSPPVLGRDETPLKPGTTAGDPDRRQPVGTAGAPTRPGSQPGTGLRPGSDPLGAGDDPRARPPRTTPGIGGSSVVADLKTFREEAARRTFSDRIVDDRALPVGGDDPIPYVPSPPTSYGGYDDDGYHDDAYHHHHDHYHDHHHHHSHHWYWHPSYVWSCAPAYGGWSSGWGWSFSFHYAGGFSLGFGWSDWCFPHAVHYPYAHFTSAWWHDPWFGWHGGWSSGFPHARVRWCRPWVGWYYDVCRPVVVVERGPVVPDIDVAWLQFGRGRVARANEMFAEIVAFRPYDAPARLGLGLASARLGFAETSVEAFRRALGDDPAVVREVPMNPSVREQIGLTRLRIGERLRLDPRDPEALLSMAIVDAVLGDIGDAYFALDRAIDAGETSDGAFLLRAELDLRLSEDW